MSILENYGPQANILSFSPRGLAPGEEYIVSLEGLKNNGSNSSTSLSEVELSSIFSAITLVADEYNEYINENSFNPKEENLYYLDTNGNYKETEDSEKVNGTTYYQKSVTELINFGYTKSENPADSEGQADGTTTLVKSPVGLMSAGPYHPGDYYYTLDLNEHGQAKGYVLTNKTYSYSEMVKRFGNMRLDLHSHASNNSDIDITDAKLFPSRTDDEGHLIKPGVSLENQIVRKRWNFFPKDPNNQEMKGIFSKEDLKLSASILTSNDSNAPTGYNPQYDEDRGKITSITGSKSNRFNLIQMLCEAFECWAKFEIEHDETGRIKYQYVLVNGNDFVEGGQYYSLNNGEDYNETEYFGDEKFHFFTDIQHNVSRIELTGLEPPNNNPSLLGLFEEANGNYVLTTDVEPQNGKNYYKLNCYKKVYCKYVTFKEFIGKDNPAGFKYGINLKSIQRDIVSDQIATKVIVQPNSNEFAPNGSCTIQQSALNPTGENALYNFQYFINHNLIDIQSLYNDLYGKNGGMGFFTKMKAWNNELQNPIYDLATINNAINKLESNQTVYDTAIEEAKKNISKLTTEINGAGGGENSYVTDKVNQKGVYESSLSDYTQKSISNKRLLVQYQEKANNYIELLKDLSEKKNKLNQDFHRKYFRFIQEGTWTSEDYYDPELYFQAANEVLYTSSFPQISYTINVLELSQLAGYEPYTFEIADKTFIEDTEFFGYDTKGRPYKEEIVVSQLVSNLDDPSQNTITVQNYKTQFQDLFQRIAAASQSLQYAEGEYKRAAGAVNPDGTINSTLMQNSLMDNELIIKNAKNQSVTWDDTGISISSFDNATSIVKLTSNGIVLTNDGGMTWTTGITGDGINASVITTGRLDTDRIRIFSEGMQTFEWNGDGLSAFVREPNIGTGNGINYNKYVRFDQYGIYGYNGDYDSSGVPDKFSDIDLLTTDDNTIFSLTWKGLALRSTSTSSNGSYLQLSAQGESGEIPENSMAGTSAQSVTKIIWAGNEDGDKFIVTDEGVLYANDGYFEGVISGSAIYGGEIHIGVKPSGGYYFEVDRDGHITGLTTYSDNNNSNGTIISSTTSSSGGTTTTTSKFDITCAEGDFSGTFSGLINTDQINLYEKQTDWSNIGVRKNNNNQNIYEIYNTTNNTTIPPGGYMIINSAQTATDTGIALEIHSNGAGRFRAEEGNLYLSTKGNNGTEWYLMLTNDGHIQTNCSYITSSNNPPTSGSDSNGTSSNTAVFG